MSLTDSVFEEFTRVGRICPMPGSWADLYRMLPAESGPDGLAKAPLPLILGAWHDSPHLSKMMRFREHLEWAEKSGVLGEVCAFLRSLPPEQWYTGHPCQ